MGFDNLFNFSLRNSALLRATLRNSYSTKNRKESAKFRKGLIQEKIKDFPDTD